METKKRIAVIGGGISGIASAYFLNKKGYRVEILESDSKIGGRAGSIQFHDKPIDIGGKNIGRRYTEFRKFVNEMGNHELEFFGINSSTVQNGKLFTIDSQKKWESIITLIQLIGIFNFYKFAKLAWAVRKDNRNGFLDGPYFSKLASKYDHQPITSYFTPRFNNSFLRPIVIRMNGSEPENYYLGNFGSNVRMVLDKYDQFKNGMSHLFNDVKKMFPIHLNTEVKEITKHHPKITGVVIRNSKNDERLLYDGVFVTTPALIASVLLKDSFPDLSQLLQKMNYNPVTLAVVRYKKNIFNPSVRAIVFDRHTALSNAGCYGIHDLNIVRYTFSGNKAMQTISEDSDPYEIIDLAFQSSTGPGPARRSFSLDRRYRRGGCR